MWPDGRLKVNVVRYADDFVITANSPEVLENEGRPWVEQFLSLQGLELAEEKIRIVSINHGFYFLGWNFRKYGEKLLIKPNVQAFYSKVREIIKEYHGYSQASLIHRLRPVLRGWARYHQPVVSKTTFHRMDAKIWYVLWRWARRRHQKKGPQCVRGDTSTPWASAAGTSPIRHMTRHPAEPATCGSIRCQPHPSSVMPRSKVNTTRSILHGNGKVKYFVRGG